MSGPSGWAESPIADVIPEPARRAGRRLLARPAVTAGLLLLALAVAGALLAPWVAPGNPAAQNLQGQLAPPSAAHPLGTDFYGRDLLTRLLYGGRATLTAALLAVTLGAAGGVLLGLISGYVKGWPALIGAGTIDLLLAFPALLLALLVVALLGPGLSTLALAVGVAGIPNYARLVRSVVRKEREAPYVEAARALGAGPLQVLARHMLPAIAGPLLAWATLDAGWAVLHVAGLGFLGLGIAPPLAEWGLMLYEGREFLATAPWVSVLPGLAITLTVLGSTLAGDALADALAPPRS